MENLQIDYNDGKWHGWNGGECPVHPKSVVDVVYLGDSKKSFYSHEASNLYWAHGSAGDDIIAFRVTKEQKEPREFWIIKERWGSSIVLLKHPRIACEEEIIHVREVLE